MSLTEYFRNPRVLTNRELNEMEREIDAISARIDELNENNCDDSDLWDHLEGRLEAIEMILTHSRKIALRTERCLELVQGGAA